MSDPKASSWSYHHDRYYSRAAALQSEYPETLKQNMNLQLALFQIRSAEAMIDKIMSELADKEEDNDPT